ncbi:MAG: DEAD/DEAH box helicase [Gemmataceae bacterium]
MTARLAAAEPEAGREVTQLSAETAGALAETLAGRPDVRERVEGLRLRIQFLRNLQMNWEPFQEEARSRGVVIRLNQLTGLQQFISFLETDGPTGDPREALLGYCVQPTGAGKTGFFAILARLLGVPTLILVPFDNLLEQTRDDLVAIGGYTADQVGLVGGGTKETGRAITVATYPGHASLMKRNADYRRWVRTQTKFVICDEVHMALGEQTQAALRAVDAGAGEHSAAENQDLDGEREVLDHLAEETLALAVKMGVTATPVLSSKRVEQYFPRLIGRIPQADLVAAGILVPYRIIQSDGSVGPGEFSDDITTARETEILHREGIYGKLLGKYSEALALYRRHQDAHSNPLRGMAFCTNHAECERFASEAQELGLRCEIVTGKEARGRPGRQLILDAKGRLVRGETDLLVTVEKLCAGFNFPEVNSIVWARVTSMAKTIQGIGRGARSYRHGEFVKDCCHVFETNWTLKGNATRGRKPYRIADALAANGEDPTRICGMADGRPLQVDRSMAVENARAEIRTRFTPRTWAGMINAEKKALRFGPDQKGLMAVASLFGVDGNPNNNAAVHLRLGEAIWGEEFGDPKGEEVRELRDRLKALYTPEQWAFMTEQEREELDLDGLRGSPGSFKRNYSLLSDK